MFMYCEEEGGAGVFILYICMMYIRSHLRVLCNDIGMLLLTTLVFRGFKVFSFCEKRTFITLCYVPVP